MMADICPLDDPMRETYQLHKGLEKWRGARWLKPASVKELLKAPLNFADKCSVLNRMRLFPAALCAAYIGATARDLHSLHRESCGVYGGQYLGNLCFSFEEMKVLVLNPEWFFTVSEIDKNSLDMSVLESFLCSGAFVGRTIAYAFLGDQRLATDSGSFYKPFRVSEIKRAFHAAVEEKKIVCN